MVSDAKDAADKAVTKCTEDEITTKGLCATNNGELTLAAAEAKLAKA